MQTLLTETVLWITSNVPVPKPNPDLGGTNFDATARRLLGLLRWAGTAAGVFGMLVSGTMISVSYKQGQNQEHLGRLGMVCAGCAIVSAAGYLVGFVVNQPVN
jgi:hypothetical protein